MIRRLPLEVSPPHPLLTPSSSPANKQLREGASTQHMGGRGQSSPWEKSLIILRSPALSTLPSQARPVGDLSPNRFCMPSCNAFLMDYCWRSVQRLQSTGRESRPSPLRLLSVGPAQGLRCGCKQMVCGPLIPAAPSPGRAWDSGAYHCTSKRGHLRAGHTLNHAPS